ncbi:MAG TPA: M1 family aminopeptidase [Kofleriaceae bacterium]|nr:M1 family aminopeptidase [Kofleriaceae bacterium]
MRREFPLPGARPRYAPDRLCDIHHIKIAIDLDFSSRSMRGVCALTLAPIADGLRHVVLDAVDMTIDRVTWHGDELAFAHDGAKLRIDLGRAADAGEVIVLDVSYHGTPRRGLYFIGPDEGYPEKAVQAWTQGQDEDSRYWFPCFDSPHEKATSEVIATVPAHFFALSNGTLISDTIAGERRTFHWRFDTPHSCYLVSLAAGELSEISDAWEDIAVTYYVSPGHEDRARRVCGRTPEMLALFSRLFGVRYPYEKYAQVFVADFIFGGMENTTATTITDGVLLDARAAIDFRAEVEDLVSHELAHQWFGDLITCRSWSEGWLNEGFATYAEYLWREHAEGTDAAGLLLDEWAASYFHEDASRYRRTVANNTYDVPTDIFDSHLYDKGGRILHMLRRILGDDGFFRSIEHYLGKHRTGSVETRDLARAVEEATGRVLDWFFDQWILRGAGHPELSVKMSWNADTGCAQVAVTQTQKIDATTSLFRLPATVRFRVGGRDVDFDLELCDEHHVATFPLAEEPSQAIFDPGKHILAKVETEKSVALWIGELLSATESLDRIDAARALGRRGGAKAEGALAKALAGDDFWGVRAQAALALGELRTDGALEILIAAATATEHPKARRGVMRALGAFRKNPRAAEVLAARIASGDDSYFVEAEACLALGKTRDARAAEVLRGVLDRDAFMDVIRQHAYRGLAELPGDDAIGVLTEAVGYGRHSYGRRAALGALAQIARGRRDRAARDIRELAEELCHDRDFRVQSRAIEALATIGDPAAIPALSAFAGSALDGRHRRRAREIIRDLREARAQGEELRSLRDELESLRAESRRLMARIDSLEAARPPAGNGQKRRATVRGAKKAVTLRPVAAKPAKAAKTAAKTAKKAAKPAKTAKKAAKPAAKPAKTAKKPAKTAKKPANAKAKPAKAKKPAKTRPAKTRITPF